ncbi:MAG: site-specific DNA-methyltransferase [Chloroflexota bacterium]|nr:site-specific DNA-methyltransferase [Chloroflexota bacterium]
MPKNDYSSWSKEDLIEKVNALEKRKKYGLVWDSAREPEKVILDCQKELPVLKEDKTKEIITNPNQPTHVLIEGDNYHALSVLNYTHQKAIDVIYIDPPYNTGSNSWKYNNKFVNSEDSFRHSKWLSFMSARLRLSRNLLKDDGIIIVTIDDHEIGNLILLMDDIFREENRLGVVTIMHNPRGRSDDKFFATSHEYALFYGRNLKYSKTYRLKLTEEQANQFPLEDTISRYRLLPLKRTGSNSTPDKRPNLYYPLYFNINTKTITSKHRDGKEWTTIYPVDSNGGKRVWRWGKTSFEERAATEIVVKGENGKYAILAKDRIKAGRKPKTVWVDPKYDASSHGTILLQQMFNQSQTFDYPKSLYAVIDTLQICVLEKKAATVLDFFAGSGTTGHAIMELNKADGGTRQFILSTNNENNICTDVCYPRLEQVIKGYTSAKGDPFGGLGGNLKYYATSFVPATPTDKNKELLTKQSIEMLTLKEDTFEKVAENPSYVIYRNSDKYTGIIFDQLSFDQFKKAVANVNIPISIYIFTLADDDFSDDFADMRGLIKICAIPESILRVYRRIFR